MHNNIAMKSLSDITDVLANYDMVKLCDLSKNPLSKRSFIKCLSSSTSIFVYFFFFFFIFKY